MKTAILGVALFIVGVTSIFYFPILRPTAWSKKAVLTEQAATPKPPPAGFGQLPLSFEANLGQADPEVKFISRGSGYTLYLTSTEIVLACPKTVYSKQHSEKRGWLLENNRRSLASVFQPFGLPPEISDDSPITSRQQLAVRSVRLRFAGAKFKPEIMGLEKLPGKSNYFIGNDPAKWRADVPHYARVACREIYPGIDLVFYGNAQQLEYDFVVSPEANPNDIRMIFNGADELRLDETGNLMIRLAEDEIRLHAPMAYQQQHGIRQPIASWFVLQADDQAGVRVAAYDNNRPLVIDPVLSYSTYAGGSGYDQAQNIAADRWGNIYVIGYTNSVDFHTLNGNPKFNGISDVFVIKLDNKNNLRYSTYLGGANDDSGEDIAVDSTGNVYLTGYTISSDFPTKTGVYQENKNGKYDIFVTKLDSSGKNLRYSTYLGGSDDDIAYDIAVDGNDNAYVTGTTLSKDFPTRQAEDNSHEAARDAFVTELNAGGNALLYSTYLGGNSEDYARDIAVDRLGNVYVVGYTKSGNLRTTLNALYPSPRPRASDTLDVFVAKYKKDGDTFALNFSTYLGGSSDDFGVGLAVDGAENIYVTGQTFSIANFMPNHINNARRIGTSGVADIFIAKLKAGSSAYNVEYLTLLGGSGIDSPAGIALGDTNNVYLAGTTAASDFKMVRAVDSTFNGDRDAVVAKLDNAGKNLIYSTYLGGTKYERSYGLALDVYRNVYVCGVTASTYNNDFFPITVASAFQSGYRGDPQDGFIMKLQSAAPALISPSEGAIDLQTPITFSWNAISEAKAYRLQISTNANFIPTIFDTTIATVSRQIGALAGNTRYHWRVRAEQGSAQSEFSPIRSFTTNALKRVSLPSSVSFPLNPTQTDYQLFSVPGVSVLTVGDILSSGKPKVDWRIYRDNGEAANFLKELSSRNWLSAGEGYWVLQKGPLDFARDLTMPRLNADATYSIPLHDGWNIIGNPFDRAVSWAAVVAANVPGLPGLKEYKQSEGYVSSNTLEPFKGYYFDNRTAGLDSLKLPYPFAGRSANFSAVQVPAVDWQVQLIFDSDINRDAENYLGVAPQARMELDALDSRKPPLFLDQGFLYFARPAWDDKYSRFSADFRPGLGEGQVWEFEVSNPRLAEGRIHFKNIGKITGEYEVWLIDLLNPARVDLRKQDVYRYQSVAAKMPFKLVVGKSALIKQEVATLVPAQFKLLQNFPNPGTPATSITFKLPQQAQIRLEVVSVLGQRVKILAEGTFPPAVYTRPWDGTDQAGKPAAAGVYFYRLLNNGKVVQTRKMILTK